MSSLTDAELIEAFVEGFLQGRPVLLSNSNLRTEPLFDSLQLISNKDGVIATAHLQGAPITMKIRHTCSAWKMLHDSMANREFYPLTRLDSGDLYLYRHCRAPEGYKMHCTTAKELWRACWGRGFGNRSGIPLDLLICRLGPMDKKQSWQALRGMDCEQGQLLLKILGRAVRIEGTDLVVWAKQTMGYQPGRRRERTSSGWNRHGYLPLNH